MPVLLLIHPMSLYQYVTNHPNSVNNAPFLVLQCRATITNYVTGYSYLAMIWTWNKGIAWSSLGQDPILSCRMYYADIYTDLLVYFLIYQLAVVSIQNMSKDKKWPYSFLKYYFDGRAKDLSPGYYLAYIVQLAVYIITLIKWNYFLAIWAIKELIHGANWGISLNTQTKKSNFLRFDNIPIHVYIRNFTWNWISKKIDSYIYFYVNLSFKAAVENVIKEEIAMKFMSFTLFYISKERQEKIVIENTCKNEIVGKLYYISFDDE